MVVPSAGCEWHGKKVAQNTATDRRAAGQKAVGLGVNGKAVLDDERAVHVRDEQLATDDLNVALAAIVGDVG